MRPQSLVSIAMAGFTAVLSGCGQSADTSKSAAGNPATTAPSSASAPATRSIAAADASKTSPSQGMATDQTTAASAAQGTAGNPAAGSPDAGAGAAPGMDDAAISAAVKATIEAEPALASQPIAVEANGTTVTLSGSVAAPSLRSRAERIAMSTPGVKNVVNHLAVKSS